VCAGQLGDAVPRAFAKPGGFRNFGKKKRRVEDESNGRVRFKRVGNIPAVLGVYRLK